MEFKIAPEGIKLRDIDIWGELYEAMERGTSVEAVITRVVRPPDKRDNGEEGWELFFEDKPGITGICSVKECGLPMGAPLNDFVRQKINCKIQRIDKKNSTVICSRKEAMESVINRLFSQLEQGEEINTLVRVVNRHVYVDIGGGVIVRINQDKARLSDGVPLDVQYKTGKILKVTVTALKKDEKLIEVEPVDPWDEKVYRRGEVLAGRVIQIRDNLAFVEVWQGLIGRVYYTKNDKYKVGDYIQVEVKEFNREKRRLHLGCYDSRKVSDRRRVRYKNRAKKLSESNRGSNDIKTLGGFDKVQIIATDKTNTSELADSNVADKQNEQNIVVANDA